MAKWYLFKYHPKQRVCVDWVDRPQNYKGLYGILQLLQGSHLDNFLSWLDSFSLINISVEMLTLSIQLIKETRPSALTYLQWPIQGVTRIHLKLSLNLTNHRKILIYLFD